ncbi:MAG: hypothetical protein Kow0068_05440 [Marinilabiliales bacterium]
MGKKLDRNKISVLCFHRVSDEKSPANPPIPVKVFDRLINYLQRKYSIISIYDIDKQVDTGKSKIILTFDDAFTDFKENALPILIKYDLPCVLNAITTCLDTGETLWTQKLNKIVEWYYFNNKKIKNDILSDNEIVLTSKNIERISIKLYLGLLHLESKHREKIINELAGEYDIKIEQSMLLWKDLKYCMENNVIIGNHTMNHLNLTLLSESELQDEIKLSTKRFVEMLDFKPDILAFPNGQYNKDVLKACKDYKYKYLLTTRKNSFYIDQEYNSWTLILPRISLYSNSILKNIFSFNYYSRNIEQLRSCTYESEHHQSCMLCQSYALNNLKGYEKEYLVKCKNCGFVFSSKIPTEKEIKEHYEQYGRDDYLSPVTVKRYIELLNKFEKYRKTNKILDIGCGIGYFLEEAKKRGWDVYGTEISEKAIEICKQKGVKMYKGKIENVNLPENTFDVITSFEVLEHINYPQEDVKKKKLLLRQGGVFYFTTPNFNSVERFLLGSKYNVICYPEHLSYYTPKTINLLMLKFGLKKLNLVTTGFSFTRVKHSKKSFSHTQFVTPASEDEKIRNKIEKNFFLRLSSKIINQIFNLFKIGNSIKGLYQKI